MIQYQILQTNITRTVWQIVRRITNEILGVKRLSEVFLDNWLSIVKQNNCSLRSILTLLSLHYRKWSQSPEKKKGPFFFFLLCRSFQITKCCVQTQLEFPVGHTVLKLDCNLILKKLSILGEKTNCYILPCTWLWILSEAELSTALYGRSGDLPCR